MHECDCDYSHFNRLRRVLHTIIDVPVSVVRRIARPLLNKAPARAIIEAVLDATTCTTYTDLRDVTSAQQSKMLPVFRTSIPVASRLCHRSAMHAIPVKQMLRRTSA